MDRKASGMHSGSGAVEAYPRRALNAKSFDPMIASAAKLAGSSSAAREFYTAQNELIAALHDAERIRVDAARASAEQRRGERQQRTIQRQERRMQRTERRARAAALAGAGAGVARTNSGGAQPQAPAAAIVDSVARLQSAVVVVDIPTAAATNATNAAATTVAGGAQSDDKQQTSTNSSPNAAGAVAIATQTGSGSGSGAASSDEDSGDDTPDELDAHANDAAAADADAGSSYQTSEHAPLDAAAAEADGEANVRRATRLSFLVNICLFVVKVFAAGYSRSLAIIASAVDSFLDIGSGAVLHFAAKASRGSGTDFEHYPEGKARLEPLAVIVFSVIMGMTSIELIYQSAQDMFNGLTNSDQVPNINIDFVSIGILIGVIGAKLSLFFYCRLLGSAIHNGNPTIEALVQDHWNDVITNVLTIVAVVVVQYRPDVWYLDPAAALIFSLYIIYNWVNIAKEQVRSVVGSTAPPQLLSQITYIAMHHSGVIEVDTVRAYSMGSGYLTEVDVVLPRNLPLRKAHDIGEALELALERLPNIQRALVHLDFESQHAPEYKRRRPGFQSQGSTSPQHAAGHSAAVPPAHPPASNRQPSQQSVTSQAAAAQTPAAAAPAAMREVTIQLPSIAAAISAAGTGGIATGDTSVIHC